MSPQKGSPSLPSNAHFPRPLHRKPDINMTMSNHNLEQVKVKQSRYRSRVAKRVPGGLVSHYIWHMKAVRSSASRTGRLHPHEIFLVLIFTRGWVDPTTMVRSEGNMSLKNPMTPPGIDPGTIRLVAQRLNHYATPGPTWNRTGTNFLPEYFGSSVSTSVH
jgi:hypothetical protein